MIGGGGGTKPYFDLEPNNWLRCGCGIFGITIDTTSSPIDSRIERTTGLFGRADHCNSTINRSSDKLKKSMRTDIHVTPKFRSWRCAPYNWCKKLCQICCHTTIYPIFGSCQAFHVELF